MIGTEKYLTTPGQLESTNTKGSSKMESHMAKELKNTPMVVNIVAPSKSEKRVPKASMFGPMDLRTMEISKTTSCMEEEFWRKKEP